MRERYASGISDETAKKMIDLLNANLANVIDLTLDGKQCHWNLQGTGFIGVHQLLDETSDRILEVSDTIAERIVILGGQPNGLASRVVRESILDDYPTDITEVDQHVRELTSRYKKKSQRHCVKRLLLLATQVMKTPLTYLQKLAVSSIKMHGSSAQTRRKK
ncbi:DNA starvation/stationary phase protection protein Dps [Psychrobacter sp. JCM 18900]|uniref:DNA starvation/stationary phase protection protein Dps n=1 Tax=Psychrobacter sp. JCM 18900 TaxID=1298608 RepID=UPI0004AC6E88|nr:DNA starvation/stationary phase protection protein Dps [Psychrobacter sp. JCM 18900]